MKLEEAMIRQIYVNLPVTDLKRSMAFFGALGFRFDPRFTNENAACMILGENMFAMLLIKSFFKTFTKKQICDATKSTEVLLCLSLEGRARVNDLVAKAAAAGGTIPREPKDHGFMYQHAFEDLDGHIWELIYMDQSAQGPG